MEAGEAERPEIEWGAAGAPLEGEESGDLEVVAPFPGGVLCALIDGLGHGVEAARAARAAKRVLEGHPGEPVLDLVQRCHEGLRGTRGAVMSLARLAFRPPSLTWVGVGNVEAVLFAADRGAAPRDGLLPRSGIVGYRIAPLRAATIPIAPGDTLIMATDGVRSAFASPPVPAGSPPEIAERLLREHARGTDDALVLCVRYLGGAP